MRRQKVWKVLRASGIWQLRWWVDGMEVGESTGLADEAQAEAERIRKEGELLAGNSRAVRGIDLVHLVDMWEQSRPNEPGHYERDVRTCLERFAAMMGRGGKLRTDRIDPAMIDRYCRRRRAERSTYMNRNGTSVSRPPVSVQRVKADLRMLRAVLGFGMERVRPRALAENPVPLAAANRIQGMPKRKSAITDDELRALLAAAPTLEAYAFLLAGWNTGGRRGELLALRWYHVDFEAKTMTVARGKNKMECILPLMPALVVALQEMHRRSPEEAGPIWPTDPLGDHGMEDLCRLADIRHHRYHDFRLTCSSRLRAKGGLDDATAARFVGHSRDVQQRHYTDLTPHVAEMMKALEVDRLPQPVVR